MRRSTVLATVTAAVLVLPAAAAWAHPSLNPNALPAGEATDTTLVVPHGCSTGDGVMPEEGEAAATTRFSLELVDGVTIEPGDVDGWDVEDDGEAIVWTDAGGATTDPISFPITVTVDGDPGAQFHLSAFQECEDGLSYRWTEGSEDTPAVLLAVSEDGEAGTVSHDDGHDDHDDHDGSEMDMDHSESEMDMDHTESEMEEMTDDPSASEIDTQALADEADSGSNAGLVAAIVLVALLAIGGAALVVRRRSA